MRGLFGGRVELHTVEKQTLEITAFPRARDYGEHFTSYYGPTIATFKRLEDEPDWAAELDAALTELAARHGAGHRAMEWEYLLVEARRA